MACGNLGYYCIPHLVQPSRCNGLDVCFPGMQHLQCFEMSLKVSHKINVVYSFWFTQIGLSGIVYVLSNFVSVLNNKAAVQLCF